MRLFNLLCLFFPVVLSAQLSIAPSGTGSSFVFVNEDVFYVEGEIQLTKNPAGPTEASIYLRKEAQLMQGNKPASKNSGDGMLSVFQEGTSNAFDYNYWAMPVTPGDGQDFGNGIYEPQNLTLSRKVQLTAEHNGFAEPLTISRRWIYKFSGQDYADWQYVGNNFNVSPGEGFTMKGVNGTNFTNINNVKNNPGNQQRYDFRGIPNDGNIHVDITKDKALLVGNPYPSAIHLKSFLTDNPNSTGIAYFWDSRENGNSHYLKDYEGGYGAYSPGANTYAPAAFKKYNGAGEEVTITGQKGDFYAREYSPIAQGFMLVGSTNGKIGFKNQHRAFKKENSENSQFRQPNKEFLLKEKIPILRLNVEIADTYIRQLVLAFREDSRTQIDWAMDAAIFNEITTDAAWLIEDKKYLINVQPFRKDRHIPLSLNLDRQTEISFSPSLEDFNPEGIFIYDAYTGNYHNIERTAFKILLDKGNYDERFFLSFINPTIEKEEKDKQEADDIRIVEIFQNNLESLLQIKIPENLILEQLRIYDLNGSLVFTKIPDGEDRFFQIPTSNFRDAIYIVELRTENEEQIIKKIAIKN